LITAARWLGVAPWALAQAPSGWLDLAWSAMAIERPRVVNRDS